MFLFDSIVFGITSLGHETRPVAEKSQEFSLNIIYSRYVNFIVKTLYRSGKI